MKRANRWRAARDRRRLTPERIAAWRAQAREEAAGYHRAITAWTPVWSAASEVVSRSGIPTDNYAAQKIKRIAQGRQNYWRKEARRAGRRWASTGVVTVHDWEMLVAGIDPWQERVR
jgi:hypothetical protein